MKNADRAQADGSYGGQADRRIFAHVSYRFQCQGEPIEHIG
jgi:hypothetical protein